MSGKSRIDQALGKVEDLKIELRAANTGDLSEDCWHNLREARIAIETAEYHLERASVSQPKTDG
jgi:hypothetical protein